MKLSILLANYNHGTMLKQCVQAVIDQTYQDWELILVDDGSSDDSAAIIGRLAAQDQRIKPLIFAQNRGALPALQSGFETATGDLFFGIAADDFLVDPTFFETAVAALADRPQAAGVVARCKIVDAADLRELWLMGSLPAAGLNSAEEALRAFFENRFFAPGGSSIWRMDLVREAGFFDAELGPQCDYFLNHALPAMADGAICLDRVVAAIRHSPGGYSSSASVDDFIRRHALVEAKLRKLPAMSHMDPATVRAWRVSIIDGRLNRDIQMGLFEKLRETQARISPELRVRMPADFMALLDAATQQAVSIEAELQGQGARAYTAFEAVAGPLDKLSD